MGVTERGGEGYVLVLDTGADVVAQPGDGDAESGGTDAARPSVTDGAADAVDAQKIDLARGGRGATLADFFAVVFGETGAVSP